MPVQPFSFETGCARTLLGYRSAPQNEDYADRRFYPSVLYHDVRIGLEPNKDFEFYMGIDNVTNRQPPLGLTGIGAGSGIYDVRGRFFYAGAIAKF